MIDFLLHVDERLVAIANAAGPWAYAVLFAIIFAETGLVVTPFLPGDSLLFAAGALGATGLFDLRLLTPDLLAAAVLGDAVNYSVGARLAHKFLAPEGERVGGPLGRLVKREHVAQAHEFFVKHGGKAVVLARFVPIVRTFAPFTAGFGQMHYPRFLAFSVGGGLLWVGGISLLGYALGNLPFIKSNFKLVSLLIIFVSILLNKQDRFL